MEETTAFQSLLDTLTGWLPDGLEPYAQGLIYLGIIGALSLIPLLAWLGWVVAFPARSETGS